MRSKLILVYGLIVVLMAMLSVAFLRHAVHAKNASPSALAERGRVQAGYVGSRFELAALAQEHWLSTVVDANAIRDVMQRGTVEARGEAASALCDRLAAAAVAELGAAPALLMVLDAQGRVVGRSGSALGRGENLAQTHPRLAEMLRTGVPGSDVWFEPARSEQHLVSYVAAQQADRSVSGGVVLGATLADTLGSASVGSDARTVALVHQEGEQATLASVRGGRADEALRADLLRVAGSAFVAGGAALHSEVAGELSATTLRRLGDGRSVALVVAAPELLVPGLEQLPWALLGLFALMLVAVVVAGVLLGAYIHKPIERIESGLLDILNGDHNRRVQLEHAELGGLAFRIDQLINQLTGVQDEATDEHGRVVRSSLRPPAYFHDAEEAQPAPDANLAQRLALEPADAYYARIYHEYIEAKQMLGEEVAHIDHHTFRARIEAMEHEALSKHGRPVRYQVKRNGPEIVLLAIAVH